MYSSFLMLPFMVDRCSYPLSFILFFSLFEAHTLPSSPSLMKFTKVADASFSFMLAFCGNHGYTEAKTKKPKYQMSLFFFLFRETKSEETSLTPGEPRKDEGVGADILST